MAETLLWNCLLDLAFVRTSHSHGFTQTNQYLAALDIKRAGRRYPFVNGIPGQKTGMCHGQGRKTNQSLDTGRWRTAARSLGYAGGWNKP